MKRPNVPGTPRRGSFDPSRRRFAKTALAAVGFPAVLSPIKRAAASVRTLQPGIKIAIQMSGNPSADDFAFAQQLGVEHVCIWTVQGREASYDNYLRLRKLIESHGMSLWNIINLDVHGMEEVVLNLPGRDKKIEEYLTHIRNLGRAGIYYTTYTHVANGVWSTGTGTLRGGALSREFNLGKVKVNMWKGQRWELPLTHGREFTQEEIWENYTYFMKRLVPVAEEAGVYIGMHPDDPPVPNLGGVPRCVLGNFQGFRRALEIANSPNIGVCLCVGTWLEGGNLMGKDVYESLRWFGERKKLFKVHFRNVDRPLPHFKETFMDDGYGDMYKVMKVIRDVNFDGILILDHSPSMVGGAQVQTAYGIGYIRGLVDAVNPASTK